MIRFNATYFILFAVGVTKVAGFLGPSLTPRTGPQRIITSRKSVLILSSLFDPDDKNTKNDNDNEEINSNNNNNSPASRKFTGYSVSSTSNSNNNPSPTVRQQMMQREFNLVSLATSPAAFLVQAASILVVLVFVLYIGATGQLGLNNDYDDGEDFIYDPIDPATLVVPTVEFQSSSSSPSVFL